MFDESIFNRVLTGSDFASLASHRSVVTKLFDLSRFFWYILRSTFDGKYKRKPTGFRVDDRFERFSSETIPAEAQKTSESIKTFFSVARCLVVRVRDRTKFGGCGWGG